MTGSGVEYRANPRFLPDNMSIKFGTAGDSRLYYDGSDLVISPADVGTGDLRVSGASLLLDSGEKIGFGAGDVMLTHAAEQLRIDGGDLIVMDGNGLVVGHTAQVTAPGNFVPEFQVLGTGVGGDVGIHVSRHSADAGGPIFTFGKGRDAIGTFTTPLSVDDSVGIIDWGAADGTDMISRVARIQALMDGNAGSNDTPGRLQFETTAPGSANATERLRIDSAGGVFINESGNAKMTVGLTINQGANDDEAFALKSSDVDHPMTGLAETDTYFAVGKYPGNSGLDGGAQLAGYSDASIAFNLVGRASTEITTDVSTSLAAIVLDGQLVDGSSAGSMGDSANLLAIRNSVTTRWLVKGNGDVHQTTDAHTALDGYEDAELVRAYEVLRAPDDVIRDEWDRIVRYNEADLQAAGILGPEGIRGLTNTSQLMRLHSGAIWQSRTREAALEVRIEQLESQIHGLLLTGA